ncbi:AtpZ/AtpI family protein [Cesiribacter sp. SM1]|uniref:AtpZ/AtpI family protein n=1 Tax=Cesiribacter sp. SM1 TaxID=2861196 RepID=UPI001CD62920|nr:AtpZ/AtpI family protein [Cesiribacter sp. SM1]
MDQPKKKSESSNQQKQSQLNSYLRYSGLAFQMMAVIGLAVWGGMKLDAWLGMRFPVCLVTLTLMSVAATLVITIKSLPKE